MMEIIIRLFFFHENIWRMFLQIVCSIIRLEYINKSEYIWWTNSKQHDAPCHNSFQLIYFWLNMTRSLYTIHGSLLEQILLSLSVQLGQSQCSQHRDSTYLPKSVFQSLWMESSSLSKSCSFSITTLNIRHFDESRAFAKYLARFSLGTMPVWWDIALVIGTDWKNDRNSQLKERPGTGPYLREYNGDNYLFVNHQLH